MIKLVKLIHVYNKGICLLYTKGKVVLNLDSVHNKGKLQTVSKIGLKFVLNFVLNLVYFFSPYVFYLKYT